MCALVTGVQTCALPIYAATGDHRYISRARQIDGRFDIAAFKESVASDIGEEQGRHASILEPARHIGNGHVGSLRPAFRRDEAVARIDSHHDPARELTCGVLHERSEEHTSELQSLMRISYAVFCLTKKKNIT